MNREIGEIWKKTSSPARRFMFLLWEHPGKPETFRFIKPHHQVHVLDRLARCALDEVVDGSDHDGTTGPWIGIDADITEVRTPHVPHIRELADRKQPHKWRVFVKVPIQRVELFCIGW